MGMHPQRKTLSRGLSVILLQVSAALSAGKIQRSLTSWLEGAAVTSKRSLCNEAPLGAGVPRS